MKTILVILAFLSSTFYIPLFCAQYPPNYQSSFSFFDEILPPLPTDYSNPTVIQHTQEWIPDIEVTPPAEKSLEQNQQKSLQKWRAMPFEMAYKKKFGNNLFPDLNELIVLARSQTAYKIGLPNAWFYVENGELHLPPIKRTLLANTLGVDLSHMKPNDIYNLIRSNILINNVEMTNRLAIFYSQPMPNSHLTPTMYPPKIAPRRTLPEEPICATIIPRAIPQSVIAPPQESIKTTQNPHNMRPPAAKPTLLNSSAPAWTPLTQGAQKLHIVT